MPPFRRFLSFGQAPLLATSAPRPNCHRMGLGCRTFASHPASRERSSVDANEISHFSGMASAWWDAQGSSRLLHLMNPMRHEFIQDCLASQSDAVTGRGLSYLDVGCGGGIFAESAARLASSKSVTALDPTPDVIAVATAHARRDPALKDKLTYRNISIEELPMPANSQNGYDIVTLFEVIEHVAQPAKFLDAVAAHVKPGGWLVLSTIARTWTSWLTTKLLAEDVLRIVPRGTHDWSKYINEDELRQHFQRQNGWTGARAMGVAYLPTLGWKELPSGERFGNYFFGIRRRVDAEQHEQD